jgi:catechol 2,3-dioxygenase-like lactoylglutathione lyase family enzyme
MAVSPSGEYGQKGWIMSRVQLALNVNNLPSAIAFYSKLFGVEPSKIRDGYANFAIDEPPLKLVLIENPGHGGSLNHLGVEVEKTQVVTSATQRLRDEGLLTDVEENTTCCFAVQDKVWVHGPDGEPWEIYTVLADADVMHPVPQATVGCCGVETAQPVVFGAASDSCC